MTHTTINDLFTRRAEAADKLARTMRFIVDAGPTAVLDRRRDVLEIERDILRWALDNVAEYVGEQRAADFRAIVRHERLLESTGRRSQREGLVGWVRDVAVEAGLIAREECAA